MITTVEPPRATSAAQIQREVLEAAPRLPTGQCFSCAAHRPTITGPVSKVFTFWGVQPA